MITILIKILNIILEIIYWPFKLLSVKKKITLISRQSDEESVDIKLLKKGIKTNIPDCEVVSLMRTIKPGLLNKILYCFHILQQMYHIATSRIVILDTYCLTISLLHHRESLTVIQMWHALGLMKKAGYSILDKPEGRSYSLAMAMKLHKNYDMIFASSEKCRKEMGEVFGYSIDKVYTFPLPRVDLLRSSEFAKETRRRILTKYPQLENRRTVVYAPTFRKDEELMQKQINEMVPYLLSEGYSVIINLHPLSDIEIKDDRVIKNSGFTTMELLTVADYVISDYSSIIYEAAIMEKPILFFAFDLDFYKTGREFFIDYQKEVPGPICSDAKELLSAIKEYNFEKDEVISFAGRYVDLSVGNCTEKITACLEIIMDNK